MRDIVLEINFIRFCQMESVKLNQMAYKLGSLETLCEWLKAAKELLLFRNWQCCSWVKSKGSLSVHLRVPRPTRQIVVVTKKGFIRNSILDVLRKEILAAVPKEMLNLQALQYIV